MQNMELLAAAIEEQETKDFSRLDRLYDRFLKCEESGNTSKAKELYEEIRELEHEMGIN